jgi:hypothetical protein
MQRAMLSGPSRGGFHVSIVCDNPHRDFPGASECVTPLRLSDKSLNDRISVAL